MNRLPQNRFLRFLLCIAAVLAAFWTYSLLAVPLIEPPIAVRPSRDPRPHSRSWNERYSDLLAQLFPPGSWQLKSPKILEIDQGLLLFKDYEPLPDGRLHVTPFTVILHAFEDSAGKPKENQRPFVMSTPAGAKLQFDQPIDLGRASFGHLVSGDLQGAIRIRSPETAPHAGDDFDITTRDIHVGENSIKTPYQVSFRFGRHFGTGKDLTIELAKADDNNSTNKRARFGRARSLQLTHIDRLYLFLKDDRILPGNKEESRRTPTGSTEPVPVEVTCLGPLHYDFAAGVVSLEDHVDVIKLNPNGSSDQLNGSRLEVHFAQNDKPPRSDVSPKALGNSRSSSMKVHRIIAIGKPATLRAPSQSAMAIAQHMEFDFFADQIHLKDSHEVQLKHEQDEVRCRQLSYKLGPPGQLGELDAHGPGTFRRIGGDNQSGMFAKWEQRFTIVKQQTGHLASLEGATRIEWPDSSCDAETVRAWVVEVPQPASANNADERKYKILPTRLEAEDNVNFDTPRLSAKTKQIEAMFEHIPETRATGFPRQREDALIASGPRSPMRNNGLNTSLPHNPSASRPTTQVQEQQQKRQKFHLTGDRIRAQVLQSGDKSTVREVAVVGNVHLRETIVDKPNALPIDVVGHTLHMVRDDQEQANIQITGLPSRQSPGVEHGASAANGRNDSGQPARVSVRGLTITAAEVNLDQASNRVWVDGGGGMTIAQQREMTNAAGNSKDPPALLGQQDQSAITWKRRMTFDGQVVRFEGDVAGSGKRDLENGQVQTFTSRSQSLLVKLNQLVDFRSEETQQEEPIDINLLQFDGGVEMDSRTFDWTRSLSAVEHVEAANLSVDYVTGRLLATGPGRLESVRRGDAGLTNRIGDQTKAKKKNPGSALSFANIHFQRAVTGNILRRYFVFQKGVEAIHGPVKSWHDRLDPNRRTGLGEDGVFLTCDKLTVLENKLSYAPKADEQQPVEMIAEGRAYARGNRFEAHGHRISIDESKHSIVLEGDAREGARILHQPYAGAPRNRLAAGKIYYSKRTGRVQWQDLTFGEVVQP